MPSNFTEHYHLSQWEKSDKVLMDDFNADNARIDAVLGDVDRRAGMKLIREAVLEETSRVLSVTLSDVPWEEYGLIIVAFDPIPGSTENITISFNSRSVGTIKVGVYHPAKYASARIIAAPMFKKSTRLNFFAMGLVEDKCFFSDIIPFGESGGASMSGTNMAAGSTIQIWGLR